MELVKNIFFNTDRLTANSIIKISYTGKFFQDHSEKVFIRYAFGNEWENYNFKIEHPETSLIVLEDNKPSKHLRKTYIWSKKIKLTIYKLLITIPKLLTGNYWRKSEESE